LQSFGKSAMAMTQNAAELTRGEIEDAPAVRIDQITTIALNNQRVHKGLHHEYALTMAPPQVHAGGNGWTAHIFESKGMWRVRHVFTALREKAAVNCRTVRRHNNRPGKGSRRSSTPKIFGLFKISAASPKKLRIAAMPLLKRLD
jgi:hypothetical protein